jgi:enoyl-[acyl-carrier protein] reductase II
MHAVFSVRHARIAEAEGVDAIIASGYEAGGLISRDELSTMVLIPQVVDAVKIPVIAAGGIADTRGFVAALALGAEGVQMGTRFVTTHECPVHQNFKQAIVKAIDTDTVITGRKAGISARVLNNKLAKRELELESSSATTEEIQSFLGTGRLQLAVAEGNTDESSLMCGAIAGMIKEVVGVGEVIHSLVDGYDKLVAGLQ